MDNTLLLSRIAEQGAVGALETETGPIVVINVPDNSATGLKIAQNGIEYLSITTTDAGETITLGNATTNPDLIFLGSGTTTGLGLEYFGESRETGVEDIAILTPATAADNISLNLEGGGALMLTNSDNGITGGNVRGANAIDLQVGRDDAAEVAYGTRSGLFAGYGNRIGLGANESVILGGQNGIIAANVTQAAIVGGINSSCNNGDRATIVGGSGAIADGSQCFIAGGFTNEIDAGGSDGAILAGRNNDVSAAQGVVIGGRSSDVTGAGGVVLGGWMGLADHPATVVFSGNTRALSDTYRGQSQGQLVHLDQRTIAGTTEVLVSGGESGGVGPWTGTELTIPANTAYGIQGKVVAWNETDQKLTTWNIDVDCYSTDGASVTFLSGDGAQTKAAWDDDSSTVALSIGSTSNTIRFSVTGDGDTSDDIRWSAVLRITRAAT